MGEAKASRPQPLGRDAFARFVPIVTRWSAKPVPEERAMAAVVGEPRYS